MDFVCFKSICTRKILYLICLLLFLLRKFLCLGDPLMCLADKASMPLQDECTPDVKVNGKYLYCDFLSVVLYYYYCWMFDIIKTQT